MVMIGGEYMSPDRLILHKIRKNVQGCDGFIVRLCIKQLSMEQLSVNCWFLFNHK